MKKLKKDELAKSVKRFLRKKQVKASDYESEFVEKTCALLTTAFNKSYDVSSSALGTIEEQVGKIHEAIFREEQENMPAKKSKPKKKSAKASKKPAKKAVKKSAKKKVVKETTKKAASKKTTTKKSVKKATSKAAKKISKKNVTTKKAAQRKVVPKKKSASKKRIS